MAGEIKMVKHKCPTMPIGYEIRDRYIVSLGIDGSFERAEKPCNFCPFCGDKLVSGEGDKDND